MNTGHNIYHTGAPKEEHLPQVKGTVAGRWDAHLATAFKDAIDYVERASTAFHLCHTTRRDAQYSGSHTLHFS
jgi:hypothetical protein